MSGTIIRVRSDGEIGMARDLVWAFFETLRQRYPDMIGTLEAYIADQDVAGQLRNFGDFFLPPKGECFLALHDGAPVGIVMLRPHGEGDGEMNRMYVREAARGRGLGRQLGEALVQEARALGYRTLWLDALYRHVEALPLYESLGFRRYSDPATFGGDDERVIHMKMQL